MFAGGYQVKMFPVQNVPNQNAPGTKSSRAEKPLGQHFLS